MDINQYMKENKLDNKELADRLKVSEGYVYMIRTGRRNLSKAIEDKLNNKIIYKIEKDSVLADIIQMYNKNKRFAKVCEALVKCW